MKRLTKFILLVLFGLVAGGAVFLATWDIPAPVADIKVVIPDARFQR